MIVISEFFEEFNNKYGYQYMSKSLAVGFEDYLKEQEIPVEKAYDKVSDYTDTLLKSNLISNKTRRNYNQKLRNFVKHVYGKQGIVIKYDPRRILKTGKE